MQSKSDVWSANGNQRTSKYRKLGVTASSLMPASQHLIGNFTQSTVVEVTLQGVEFGVRTAQLKTKRSPVVADVKRYPL